MAGSGFVRAVLLCCAAVTAFRPPLSAYDPRDIGITALHRSGGVEPNPKRWNASLAGKPLPTNEWWGNFAVEWSDESVEKSIISEPCECPPLQSKSERK